VLLAGAIAVAVTLASAESSALQAHWLTFAVLTMAATCAQLVRTESPDHHLYYVSLVFFFAGILLLPPSLLLLLIIVPHLAEWIAERMRGSTSLRDWYLQPFNVSTHAICALLAQQYEGGAIISVAQPNTIVVANALVAAFLYVLLNHLLVGLALVLARGLRWHDSGILDGEGFQSDLIMLLIGLTFAVLWTLNHWLAFPALLPLLLIYRVLKIPGLKRQTQIDSKTGLFNADYFKGCLERELDRARRFDRPLTLAVCDLDLLRDINEAYGHMAGDSILEALARLLGDAARESDIVARLGSEEFALLLPETTVEEAQSRMEGLRQLVEMTEFSDASMPAPIRVTVSLGLAGRTADLQLAEELIHRADQALFMAKRKGRNRVSVYQPVGDSGALASPTTLPKVPVFSSRGPGSPLAVAILNSKEQPGEADGTIGRNLVGGDLGCQNEAQSDRVHIDPRYDVGYQHGEDESLGFQKELPTESIVSYSAAVQKEYPAWAVHAYVVGVSLFALAMSLALMGIAAGVHVDTSGLIVFVVLALLAELLAIEVYHKDTTVSTSVAALLGGAMLFGPVGAVALAVAIAFASWIRHRTPSTQLLFNASNHAIGGLVAAAVVLLGGKSIREWPLPIQELMSLGAVALIYVTTTMLLAIAIGLRGGRQIRQVWNERFRWMAPYYLGLGVVAHALVFSYGAAGTIGVLAILVPLLILRYSQKQYLDHTKELVARLRRTNVALAGQAAEITLLNEELLLTLANSIDLRDPYVMEHSKNVSRYATLTAMELGLAPERVEQIRKAGLLHDIGKLGIPEAILFKPDRLVDHEYSAVREHVEVGATLMRGCHTLRVLIPFVKHHHERFDGSGYPDRLAGEAIPLEARILGLADAVEAMASDRPYKKALTAEAILEEIRACAGTQFDPVVASAFERVVHRGGSAIIVNSAREVELRHRNAENGNVAYSERG
jgi:diguanylate cyclase (GGDEF)-like protein/putative nucleotidyltransferase with HDIG domain